MTMLFLMNSGKARHSCHLLMITFSSNAINTTRADIHETTARDAASTIRRLFSFVLDRNIRRSLGTFSILDKCSVTRRSSKWTRSTRGEFLRAQRRAFFQKLRPTLSSTPVSGRHLLAYVFFIRDMSTVFQIPWLPHRTSLWALEFLRSRALSSYLMLTL